MHLAATIAASTTMETNASMKPRTTTNTNQGTLIIPRDTGSVLRRPDSDYEHDDDRNHRNQRNRENRQVYIETPRETPRQEPKQSYRDILSRSRQNSQTSLQPRRSNPSLSRRNSRHDQQPLSRGSSRHDMRDRNTAPPRNTGAQPQRERNDKDRQQPKNGQAPLGGGPSQASSSSKQATNQEMMDFITMTMRSLESFKEQLRN